MSSADFSSQFNKPPVINQTYAIQGLPWAYTVTAIDGDQITLIQDAKVGQIVPLDKVFYLVITVVRNDSITSLLTAEEQTLQVPTGNLTISLTNSVITLSLTPKVGDKITIGNNKEPGKVLRFDEGKIYLDYNS